MFPRLAVGKRFRRVVAGDNVRQVVLEGLDAALGRNVVEVRRAAQPIRWLWRCRAPTFDRELELELHASFHCHCSVNTTQVVLLKLFRFLIHVFPHPCLVAFGGFPVIRYDPFLYFFETVRLDSDVVEVVLEGLDAALGRNVVEVRRAAQPIRWLWRCRAPTFDRELELELHASFHSVK